MNDPARSKPARWPDTTDTPAPADHPDASAAWLLGRHTQLAHLAGRCPGVVGHGSEDGPDIDLDLLAEGVAVLDQVDAAVRAYEAAHRAPRDEHAWERWHQAAPQLPPTEAGDVAAAIAGMSRTEQTRLRLLATFATTRVGIRVMDFDQLDANGTRLLRDWVDAGCPGLRNSADPGHGGCGWDAQAGRGSSTG